MRKDDPAQILRRRFLHLLILAAVPLTAIVVLLAWREYDKAHGDILQELAGAQQVRRLGLEQLVDGVDTHIAVMRAYAERRLDQEAALPVYAGALDWIDKSEDPGPGRGMILADPATLTPEVGREISAVQSIFALAQATHATRPYLRWSYYFSESRAFVAIYPWAQAAQMLDPVNPSAALAGYFGYDLYARVEPGADPDKAHYWTPVYVDAGGAGLMVSHTAPVWSKGRFRGAVGTDVLLSYFGTFLADFPPVPGRIALVDQDGNLISGPETGQEAPGSAPRRADAVLGGLDLSDTAGAFVQRGRDLVSSSAVAGTPWRLVMAVPQATVDARAAARLTPFALMLAGILASLAAGLAMFNRQFVRPAVALADFASRRADDALARGGPEDLPSAWQPLAARILDASRREVAQMAQLRAMLDGVPLRVVYLDANLIYRDANREFLAFLGKSRGEVIGHAVREILGEAVEAQYRGIAPMIQRGEIGRFEGWIDYVTKGRLYLQVSILPFQAAGEAVPGFLTFTRDLTELKQAEQEAEAHRAALNERQDRYRSVVVSALDAIVVMDDEGVTLEFNPAAERIFGYRAVEAVGRKVGDLIVPPAARAAHTQGMARYLASGEARVVGSRIEVEGMRKDGSLLPVELTVTEFRAGERRLFISHLRDLTEVKDLERAMQEGRDRLHQVEKLSAMGSLLAGVAHELNNPLAIAVAQSTLLVDKAPDQPTRDRAERILAAANRCGRIVKSFLAMARQKPPQREVLALAGVVRNSLEVVGYGLRSAGVEVELDLPEDLPAVNGDRDLLGQVFSNLFINAQQALTGRPLPRRIRVTGRREGEMLRLLVEDNGPGVPEAVKSRIFDPYFTTKAVEVGTGIGLSISRNVIEAHGGVITLGMGSLGGACFEITLPAVDELAQAAEGGAEADRARVARRFLVVDDEPDVGGSLAEMLELAGHRAEVVTGSDAALARLEAEGFDAVFTDLRMPGVDGAELALRAIALRPALAGRVVLMTGDTVAGPSRAAELGLKDILVLEKPFSPEDVAKVVRAALA